MRKWKLAFYIYTSQTSVPRTRMGRIPWMARNMLIFTYEIVKMRFNLETENLICAFPLLETRTTTINRTGKQEKRLMKMPQGLKNRNLIFQK